MILGTRGSALALAQTDLTTAALRAAHPDLEISRQIIQTTGDLRQDLRLGRPDSGADKGVWTRELETALASGAIHAAVHSAKDIPTELPLGFRLAACLPRAAVSDALISKHPGGLDGLPSGAAIATSSVRRARQLRHLRPDVQIIEIRGNVPTRLAKLAENPALNALVLAQAGLDRLGCGTPWFSAPQADAATPLPHGLHASLLPAGQFLPAAAQGIVALEVFGENAERDALLAAITHAATWRALRAEREFLRLLKAGCHTPVGLLSQETDAQLTLRALVFPDDETSPEPPRAATITAPAHHPEAAAAQLFQALK